MPGTLTLALSQREREEYLQRRTYKNEYVRITDMASQTSFSMATYNMEISKKVKQLVNNISILGAHGVSVFCLQEVSPKCEDDFIINHILEKLGGNWKSEYFVDEVRDDHPGFGTAIVWNTTVLKLLDFDRIGLPKLSHHQPHEKAFIWATGFGGKPISRKTSCATFLFNKKKIRIISVHMDVLGGQKHRYDQATFLLNYLKEKEPVDAEIIAGDFNTTDILRTKSEKKKLHTLFGQFNFTDITDHIPWTQDIYDASFARDGLPLHRMIHLSRFHMKKKLDYIWVRNLKLIESHRADLKGSDHYPVVAELEV